ncbi:MAG: hypothetical protein P4L99_01195 [Chthoniobacter sp.]|nr:hypothetical protein [Chthoniobacter sp.]
MNPKTSEQIKAARRIKVDAELPMKDTDEAFIRTLVANATSPDRRRKS